MKLTTPSLSSACQAPLPLPMTTMTTSGDAGAQNPDAAGALGGAPVLPYVWPTSLDPSAVGFAGVTCAPKTPPDLCRVRPTKGRTNEGTIYG